MARVALIGLVACTMPLPAPHVSAPAPTRIEAWDETPLDPELPRDDCPYGGRSPEECATGCTITVEVVRSPSPYDYLANDVQRETRTWRFAAGRTHEICESSNGSVSFRSTIERGDETLRLQVDGVTRPDTDWLALALDRTHPAALGVGAARTREHGRGRRGERRVRWDRTTRAGWLHREWNETDGAWRRARGERRRTFERHGADVLRIERFDARGRVREIETRFESREPPRSGTEVAVLARDAAGNVRAVHFDGETVRRDEPPEETFEHDAAGRVVSRRRDGRVDRVTYDAEGRVRAVRGPMYTLDVVRDDRGRVRWEHLLDGRVRRIERRLTRAHDDEGRLVRSHLEVFGRWARDETAAFAYDGTCEGVETPLLAEHALEVDAPLAWWLIAPDEAPR
ncbi:MAG: hypothetical protein H6722_10675 [Sandaracinus sp.]|nr:hypothetical protein [Myxococcales bacterium]MCB9612904.1 hypothetical protein [Sandaracinus sp.]